MTEVVDVYGFGSFFFRGAAAPRDVDLLIVHPRVDQLSIHFAIRCKWALRNSIGGADVVMLSKSEERELAFIKKCRGHFLMRLTDTDRSAQFEAISRLTAELSLGLSPRPSLHL